MIEQIKKNIEHWTKVLNYYEHSDFLKSLPEYGKISITLNAHAVRILVRVIGDYKLLLSTLKELRKEGDPLIRATTWSSHGCMLFSWENDLIQIWFECDPAEVPEELMPSKTCKVVKEVTESVNYAIVCEVEND